MKVTITEMEQCLWMRDSSTGESIASKGYIKDGTQEKIIAALEEALLQAKSELLCWND